MNRPPNGPTGLASSGEGVRDQCEARRIKIPEGAADICGFRIIGNWPGRLLQHQTRCILPSRRHPAHSQRIDDRPMRLFDFGQQVRRCFSGELFEVMNEMHLIVITERVRNLGPGSALRPCRKSSVTRARSGNWMNQIGDPQPRLALDIEADHLPEPGVRLEETHPGRCGRASHHGPDGYGFVAKINGDGAGTPALRGEPLQTVAPKETTTRSCCAAGRPRCNAGPARCLLNGGRGAACQTEPSSERRERLWHHDSRRQLQRWHGVQDQPVTAYTLTSSTRGLTL